jgi:hypothetical protein
MKKKVLSVVVCILLLIITGCGSNRKLNVVSDKLNINLDGCKIKKYKDTHGGFLGDGDTFAKIVCDDTFDKDQVLAWIKSPLPEYLTNSLDMEQCSKKGCFDVYEKYGIPRLEDGRYYWRNTKPDQMDTVMTNYYIGIYDKDNNILYFYEYDS